MFVLVPFYCKRVHFSYTVADAWKTDLRTYRNKTVNIRPLVPDDCGVLTRRVHVMSACLGLGLRLGLSHHGGAEWVHHGRLAGPRGCMGNISRGSWGGAWAAWVKGWRAAMETSPAVSTTPNAAVAQIHWQSLLWGEGGKVKERSETNFEMLNVSPVKCCWH